MVMEINSFCFSISLLEIVGVLEGRDQLKFRTVFLLHNIVLESLNCLDGASCITCVSVYVSWVTRFFFYVFFSLDVVSPGFHIFGHLNIHVPNG